MSDYEEESYVFAYPTGSSHCKSRSRGTSSIMSAHQISMLSAASCSPLGRLPEHRSVSEQRRREEIQKIQDEEEDASEVAEPEVVAEKEESFLDSLGAVLWCVVTGGVLVDGDGCRQCFSERNRTQDSEAANRASQTGRPPGFPAPQGHSNPEFDAPRVPRPATCKRGRPLAWIQRSTRRAGAGKGGRSRSASPASSGSHRGRTLSYTECQSLSPRSCFHSEAAFVVNSRCSSVLSSGDGHQRKGGSRDSEQGHFKQKQKQPWKWPPWVLQFEIACIEVLIEDEGCEEAQWVQGVPLSQVVDPYGNDLFLCVEYKWGGEYFVQDFSPEHVRQRGKTATVQDLLQGSV
mmetsp:Transcript_46271/g.106811  ORF Transcript_46271/g.106811 Transcript_46271/m.106811 type:complete len:347 (+) Transcript_46271:22-1062(+)